MAANSLQTVVETGGLFVNTVGALRGLIAAASEDDVDLQTVLAIDKLGTCIPVAPDRIAEAYNALGSQTSVRVDNLKAWIGIASGGLCRMVRKSTPLLQFFVFCAACKMMLPDQECSNMVFEMMKMAGVLVETPCSAIQISRVIASFSGQAYTIAPTELIHKAARAVDREFPIEGIYRSVDLKATAELFVVIFDHMRDEGVKSAILRGHFNSVWLVSTLLWLFQGKAFVQVGEKLLEGDPGAKLSLIIEPKKGIPWSLQLFRAFGDPIEFVYEVSNDENVPLTPIPLRLTKSYVVQSSWNAIESEHLRRELMLATGTLAQTLIEAVVDHGYIYAQCNNCKLTVDRCKRSPLQSIAHADWLANAKTLLISYGWSEDDEVESDLDLRQAIESTIVDRRRTRFKANTKDTYRGIDQAIYDRYSQIAGTWFEDLDEHFDYWDVLHSAFDIAADALVTSSVICKDSDRYMNPCAYDFPSEVLSDLLIGGLDVHKFREFAFRQLLPGLEPWHHSDLVVAKDGRVVGMNLLWNESCQVDAALSIRMLRGVIRHENVGYTSIREVSSSFSGRMGERVPAFNHDKGLHIPDAGRGWSFSDRFYSFETLTSTYGARLEIKPVILSKDSLGRDLCKETYLWITAIKVLATAFHIDESTIMEAQQDGDLDSGIAQKLCNTNTCWAEPVAQPEGGTGARTLLHTSGNIKVKIATAAMCGTLIKFYACTTNVIRHRGELIKCIAWAESRMRDEDSGWTIID